MRKSIKERGRRKKNRNLRGKRENTKLQSRVTTVQRQPAETAPSRENSNIIQSSTSLKVGSFPTPKMQRTPERREGKKFPRGRNGGERGLDFFGRKLTDGGRVPQVGRLNIHRPWNQLPITNTSESRGEETVGEKEEIIFVRSRASSPKKSTPSGSRGEIGCTLNPWATETRKKAESAQAEP